MPTQAEGVLGCGIRVPGIGFRGGFRISRVSANPESRLPQRIPNPETPLPREGCGIRGPGVGYRVGFRISRVRRIPKPLVLSVQREGGGAVFVLAGEERVVVALARHELGVRAALDDLAVADDEDDVGPDNRRKAVGNHE